MIYLMMIDGWQDKRKFEVVYEQYRYLMMKVAYDVLHDSYLAEDAVHEAFIKVAKNMDKIGEADSVVTKRYLIVITKNTAIDIYRVRKKRMMEEIYADELGDNCVPLSYMESDMENEVLEVLKNLPVKYRDVFLLRYSSQMSYEEIAEILNIPEGTIRQRIARGKNLIQKEIEKLEVMGDGAY